MKLIPRLFAMGAAGIAVPLAAQDIPTEYSAQVEAAAAARSAGEYDKAREILQSLLALSPDNVDLLRRLAMVEAADGKLDVAMQTINNAARLAPDDLDVALARAYILNWRGETAAAEATAAMISARDPNYPDLAELQASLKRKEKSQGVQLRAISVGAGLSSIKLRNGSSQTWNNQSLVVALDTSADDTVSLGAMREERNASDIRLSARFDKRIDNGFGYVAATVVPNADFQEKWSLAAGGEAAAAPGLTALGDVRVAKYETGMIVAFQPGLRVAFGPDFSVTGKAINIFGGGQSYRLGGSLRLDYGLGRQHSLFAIAASYPDVEADGVQQLRSAAVGFAVPVFERLSLSAAGSYENRANSYRRWTGSLALTHRFGPR